MEQAKDLLDGVVERGERSGAARGIRSEVRLRDLDKAVAEISPNKIIECLGNIAESVGLITFVDTLNGRVEAGEEVAGEER